MAAAAARVGKLPTLPAALVVVWGVLAVSARPHLLLEAADQETTAVVATTGWAAVVVAVHRLAQDIALSTAGQQVAAV
jgi:hypothetical protein